MLLFNVIIFFFSSLFILSLTLYYCHCILRDRVVYLYIFSYLHYCLFLSSCQGYIFSFVFLIPLSFATHILPLLFLFIVTITNISSLTHKLKISHKNHMKMKVNLHTCHEKKIYLINCAKEIIGKIKRNYFYIPFLNIINDVTH